MRGRPAGFETTALVDGDIDQHCAGLHRFDHGAGHELRCRGAGDEHGADDEVRVAHELFDRVSGRVHGFHLTAEDGRQLPQPLDRSVDHGDVCAHADGHFRRVRSGNAAAQHHDLCGGHAGHTAQQDSESAVGLLQTVGAHLHGHAPGDLAHGREQRQRAVGRGDGLICNRSHARGEQRLRLVQVRSQMQIREQGLPAAQLLAFGDLRFLDLHNEIGGRKDVLSALRDRRSRRLVVRILEADT